MIPNTASWQAALEVLGPLEARLDAALAAGDVASAIRLAFRGAARAASIVSEVRPKAGMATVHGVMVELTPLPLDSFEDGTLAENGAYVSLTYRSWDITPAVAECLEAHWGRVAGWTVDSS